MGFIERYEEQKSITAAKLKRIEKDGVRFSQKGPGDAEWQDVTDELAAGYRSDISMYEGLIEALKRNGVT